jgi:undecaprenyl-diphosphatase
MGEFLAEIAGRVVWAVPVGVVLWFVARRLSSVVPSPTGVPASSTGQHRPAWQRAAGLLVAAVLVWALAVALGWLITSVLGPVRDLDVAIIDWFGTNRTDAVTAVAFAIDFVGDTPGIVAALLITAPVAHALTRRWAPAFVLVLAAAGETSIFLVAQFVIRRARPEVEHLAVEPVTSSFFSGHVAATFATYACLALLVISWGRSPVRFAAIGVALVLPLAVAWSRMYQGMHFPSDVLVSLVVAPLWLAACWWALQPGPRGESVRFGPRARAEELAATPRHQRSVRS